MKDNLFRQSLRVEKDRIRDAQTLAVYEMRVEKYHSIHLPMNTVWLRLLERRQLNATSPDSQA